MPKRYFLFFAVLYYLFIIFSFSAQTAEKSTVSSKKVTTAVYNVATKVAPSKKINKDDFIKKFHNMVRKTAHFMNFFVLAILTASYARCFKRGALFCYVLAVLFCFGIASCDEFHQLFVSGRSGEIKDVLIDTCGSACGAFFHTLIYECLWFKSDFRRCFL